LLLEAARTVFGERGYQGATVAAITREAHTAHGTFYLYFDNREDVFLQVVNDLLDELYQHSFTPIEDLPSQGDAGMLRERIAAFITAWVAHGPLWRALLEASLASARVQARWMEHRRRFHATLSERLTHFGVELGGRALDADTAAYALNSMLEWYALTGTVFEEPRALEASDDVIDTLTTLWMRALGG